MFENLIVKNFRGFNDLTIERLSPISLFIGQNNIGKTAVLESLFLLHGPTNPQLPGTINAFRGVDTFLPQANEVWGWLFRNRSKPIEIQATTMTAGTRSLTISLAERKEFRLGRKAASQREDKQSATATTEITPGELVLELEHESGKRIRSRASLIDDRLIIDRSATILLPTAIFVSARAGYTPENPQRYSRLEEGGDEKVIIAPLQLLEPRLKRLAILITPGGPMIHGDLGLSRMVPLPFMGEGTGRLLTILLSIASSTNGSVFIDDIDSGFHYSVMANVWTAISRLAREKHVQVFCSTHSWECLKSAHEALSKEQPYDLTVHRLDRDKEDIRATDYDKKMLNAAIKSGMELR